MQKIILVGNPNTGKTTVFNYLTKSNEHVGNWHGVTVEEKSKLFKTKTEIFELVDLPGIYSTSPLSFEEEVSTKYLDENINAKVLNICDANNLRRNLFLTLELLEKQLDITVLVNEMDKQNKLYNKINYEKLSKKLNIPILVFNKNTKKNIKNILKFEKKLKKNEFLTYFFKKNENKTILNIINNYNLDENIILDLIKNKSDFSYLNNLPEEIKKSLFNYVSNFNYETLARIRYEYIDYILEDCLVKVKNNAYGYSTLDKLVLNKVLGPIIFFAIMIVIFYLTFFSLGAKVSELLRNVIQNDFGNFVVDLIKTMTNEEWIIDFFQTALIGGVGSLICFLPQICLLFFFLSLLEDSGYLSRVAFLMEDIFSKLGLSGKSVYTLLMGFGCSTTATLTARNMEDKNSKIKTIMLTPYMSCSAKLPIYSILGGAFFGAGNVLIVFLLYVLGVVIALLLSSLLEKKILKSKQQSFILEFSPYRLPSFFRILSIILENIKLFLIRIGSLLICLNIIIWLLQSFNFRFQFIVSTGGVSMLENIGKIFAPIFIPLGFGNWGATSALFAGLIAKEIIISAIAMFNGIRIGQGDVNSQVSNSVKDATMAVCFTPASALSYMVFCLLYFPCIATLSVMIKEIGKKWTAIAVALEFSIAYAVSFVIFKFTNMFVGKNIMQFVLISICSFAIIFSFCVLIIKLKRNKTCSNCKNCSNNCNRKF